MKVSDTITEREYSIYDNLHKQVYGVGVTGLFFDSYDTFLDRFHKLIAKVQAGDTEQLQIKIFEDPVEIPSWLSR
jgi:hypothetical protein